MVLNDLYGHDYMALFGFIYLVNIYIYLVIQIDSDAGDLMVIYMVYHGIVMVATIQMVVIVW